MQSLLSKSSALEFAIIVFCETWLNENHINSKLLDPQLFNIYSKDRCPKNSGFSRGDGVLIGTRNHFNAKTLNLHFELLNLDIDQFILQITIQCNICRDTRISSKD